MLLWCTKNKINFLSLLILFNSFSWHNVQKNILWWKPNGRFIYKWNAFGAYLKQWKSDVTWVWWSSFVTQKRCFSFCWCGTLLSKVCWTWTSPGELTCVDVPERTEVFSSALLYINIHTKTFAQFSKCDGRNSWFLEPNRF